MAEALAYESWIDTAAIDGDQSGSTWDQCKLGGVFLPGVITIEDFEYGVDIDIQKKRKKEKCRIRDNGLAPCAFNIKIELRAAQWVDWQRALPAIQPRREGAIRTALKIEHPLPNSCGVRDIYVHKIKIDPPSARRGMCITIKVAEWFEEEKESKGAKKGTPVKETAPARDWTGFFKDRPPAGPRDYAADFQNAPTVTQDDAMNNMFTDPDFHPDPFVGVGA